MAIELKSPAELELMRTAARIVAETLDLLEDAAVPGVTLNELDRLAFESIRRNNVESSFLGYNGYPKVLCTSVNDVVVHGIPDDRQLVEGDILGIDFGVSYRGFHGDSARTIAVGQVSPEARRLMQVTHESLWKGIAELRHKARIGDIGAAVQAHAEAHGYSVVRDFVGHGIGRRMHEEPNVPNYGPAGRGPRLRTGMVLAIEPMVNEGTWEVEVLEDRWTVLTRDRRLSAHFEHTVALTENGPEVLTLSPRQKAALENDPIASSALTKGA